jgi:hypothetical protein
MGINGGLFAMKPEFSLKHTKFYVLPYSSYRSNKLIPLTIENDLPAIEEDATFVELRNVPWTAGCYELHRAFKSVPLFTRPTDGNGIKKEEIWELPVDINLIDWEVMATIDWLPKHIEYTMKLLVSKGFVIYWSCGF